MKKTEQSVKKEHGPNERAQELNAIARQTPPPVEDLPEKEKTYVLQIRSVYQKCADHRMGADEAQAWQRWLQSCLLQEPGIEKMVRESKQNAKS